MSFGTYFTTEHYFNRENYASILDVENAIDEDTDLIENIEQQLLSLAVMTEPSKIIPQEEGTDYLTSIPNKVKYLLDTYKSTVIHRSLLYKLKEEWDNCHTEIEVNGKKRTVAKYPPETGTEYLCGDYIETDKYPNEDE